MALYPKLLFMLEHTSNKIKSQCWNDFIFI